MHVLSFTLIIHLFLTQKWPKMLWTFIQQMQVKDVLRRKMRESLFNPIQNNWPPVTCQSCVFPHPHLPQIDHFSVSLIPCWCVYHPDLEKPQVGSVTVSDVSWDSFLVSWTMERGGFESFLIEVESEGGEETHNLTLPGDVYSQAFTGLLPATLYKVTLYGVYRGNLLEPVFAETTTGTNVQWAHRHFSRPFLSFFFPLFLSSPCFRHLALFPQISANTWAVFLFPGTIVSMLSLRHLQHVAWKY